MWICYAALACLLNIVLFVIAVLSPTVRRALEDDD